MSPEDKALLKVGRYLQKAKYRFVTPTPSTVERVRARSVGLPSTLRDIFGWNRPFRAADLPKELFDALDAAEARAEADGLSRSLVRFSTIGNLIFLHSGFPTSEADAVFFGPDTYRFVRAIGAALRNCTTPDAVIVDIGAGSGAGGLYAASLLPGGTLTLADINARALRYCAINAELNGIAARICDSDVLNGVAGEADIILSNPPYLVDGAERLYRHGGGGWGSDLSLRIVAESLEKIAPNGLFLLYTGTPVVAGTDMFHREVRPLLKDQLRDFRYEEIDPDVFGEELAQAPYDEADRIAVVQLIVRGQDLRKNSHAA